jgi:hypothetical protein
MITEGDIVVMIETCTWRPDRPAVMKGTICTLEEVGHKYAKIKGSTIRILLKNCRKIDPEKLTKLEKVLYEIKEE